MIEEHDWPPTFEAIADALAEHPEATHLAMFARSDIEAIENETAASTRVPLVGLTDGDIEAGRIRLSADVGDLEPKLSWWVD